MLISQTEKTVEWEQVSSKEQVLPMPGLNRDMSIFTIVGFREIGSFVCQFCFLLGFV
jgi:hypothetical protein